MPPFDQQVTFLYTRDLPATAAFYETVLGFDLVLDQGTCRIYRISDDGFLGFCTRAEADARASHVIFTMVTDDVDAWHERVKAAGALVEKPPSHSEQYNVYQFFFRDPNGYLLEIQQFRDPAWPRKNG